MTYDVAIVGVGEDPRERSRDGFAMGYRHASAYEANDDTTLVACADLSEANGRRFAHKFDIQPKNVYQSYEQMLAEINPDIVSICVPPSVHAEIVCNCARAAGVQAIHCEKPMATTWSDCKDMVRTCNAESVQLTIDHQRRFSRPVQAAKALVDNGEIGDLTRLSWSEVNLFDAGSHLFDLCDLFVDGAKPAWTLAAVDATVDRQWFGTRNTDHALAQWEYDSGVQGLASTADGNRTTFVDPYLRIEGTEGEIEIQPPHGPACQLRTTGGWQEVDTNGEGLYGPQSTKVDMAVSKLASLAPGVSSPGVRRPNYARAIDHAVESLSTETEPIISGEHALRGTELIFGCWESARRGQRIAFPLEIDDNPLEAIAKRTASMSAQ